MQKGTIAAGCSRFGMTDSFVPFQPNVNPDGSANAAAGKDDAILYGARQADPGGLPLGTLEYLTFSRFYNAPGEPFHGDAAPEGAGGHARRPAPRADRAGGLDRRRAPSRSRPSTATRRATVTFNVTPARRRRGQHELQDLGHAGRAGTATGYTDDVVRVVSPGRGPLPALGQLGRVRQLARGHGAGGAPARPLGRDPDRRASARRSRCPVVVHNWSDDAAERHGHA